MQNTLEDNIKQFIRNRFNQLQTIQLFRLFEHEYNFKKIDHCFIIYEILLARNVQIPKQIIINIKNLNTCKKNLEECFSHFKSDRTDWRIEKFGNNSCSSKIFNKSQIMMLFEGVLDINIFKLATMLYDVAKYSQWFPFCKQSSDILNIGLAEKLVFLTFGIPFLSNREAFINGQGFNRIQTANLINLYVSSVTGDKEIQEKYKVKLQVKQQSVGLNLKFLTVELIMIKPDVFDFKMFIHVDINVQFLPEMVLGYMSKKFGEFLFNKMINRANSLDQKEFQIKLKEKTLNFYHWLDITIKQWEKKYHDQQIFHIANKTSKKLQLSYPQMHHIHMPIQKSQYIPQQHSNISQHQMYHHSGHIQNTLSSSQQSPYQSNVIKK